MKLGEEWRVSRFILALILCLFLAGSSVLAQGYYFLPIIMKDTSMSNAYGLYSPVSSTNYVLNPSAEIAGNHTSVGSATVTRSTTYQKYGLYSYRVQTTGNGDGLQVTLSALTNSVHFVTARIRNPGTELNFVVNSITRKAVLLEKIDNNWSLYGSPFPASVSGGTTLRINQIGAGSNDFNVDGIQAEPLGYWTTYIDGTQTGCEWNGTAHGSTSTRSGQSKAGGRVMDFYKDYGFFLERIIGGGDAAITVTIDEYALLPGGEFNSEKIHPREFTLIGRFIADTEEELHDNRQALKLALDGDQYPGNQPTPIRYSGGRVQKVISARYQNGLEGNLGVFYGNNLEPGDDTWTKLNKFTEKASIQFIADDPFWYEVGESAALLDTSDSATLTAAAVRLRSTGQWDDMGPPNAAGTYTAINAIAEDVTYVYYGGDFLNFNNIANADYIVRWNKSTQTWSALDTGLNGIVRAIQIGPDGLVYIGGFFTNAGGVAAADYLAVWDGSNFAALGTPNTGAASITAVYAIHIDRYGDIFIGGLFDNWADVANADNIVVWDISASAYVAVSTGTNGIVRAFAELNGVIYVGGVFTTFGGVALSGAIGAWDYSTVSDLPAGGAVTIQALATYKNTIAVGGSGGDPFAIFNGQAWTVPNGGVNAGISRLDVGPDDLLYLSGSFTVAGDLPIVDRSVAYNGYAFFLIDIDLPGTPGAILYASRYTDPVLKSKYDLYIGFTTSGTGSFSGSVNATNEGSALAFPDIHITRSGGTTATLAQIKNNRNGLVLSFNYSLLDGEELVISLYPRNRQIVSSFFGSRLDAVLPNCNFGTWHLPNGTSQITSFVVESGSPTVTAWLLWQDAYKGYD